MRQGGWKVNNTQERTEHKIGKCLKRKVAPNCWPVLEEAKKQATPVKIISKITKWHEKVTNITKIQEIV